MRQQMGKGKESFAYFISSHHSPFFFPLCLSIISFLSLPLLSLGNMDPSCPDSLEQNFQLLCMSFSWTKTNTIARYWKCKPIFACIRSLSNLIWYLQNATLSLVSRIYKVPRIVLLLSIQGTAFIYAFSLLNKGFNITEKRLQIITIENNKTCASYFFVLFFQYWLVILLYSTWW